MNVDDLESRHPAAIARVRELDAEIEARESERHSILKKVAELESYRVGNTIIVPVRPKGRLSDV